MLTDAPKCDDDGEGGGGDDDAADAANVAALSRDVDELAKHFSHRHKVGSACRLVSANQCQNVCWPTDVF